MFSKPVSASGGNGTAPPLLCCPVVCPTCAYALYRSQHAVQGAGQERLRVSTSVGRLPRRAPHPTTPAHTEPIRSPYGAHTEPIRSPYGAHTEPIRSPYGAHTEPYTRCL